MILGWGRLLSIEAEGGAFVLRATAHRYNDDFEGKNAALTWNPPLDGVE